MSDAERGATGVGARSVGDGSDGEGGGPSRVPDGPRRLGWWLLPLFLAVGLAGAVLATALVVVSQTQRIDALRDETAAARSDLADVVDEVESTAGQALSTIRDEVAAVRDGLSTELPLEDAAEAGVVHLRAEVPAEPSAAPTAAPTSATTPPDPDPEPVPDADDDPDPEGEPGPDPDEGDDGPDEDRQPAPAEPRSAPTTTRAAAGFVAARDGDTTFLVTTFALLADPRGGDRPVDRPVQVRTAVGEVTGQVHSWDAAADLLLLRVGGDAIAPLPWRPEDRPLGAGDRVVAVGVTPTLEPVRVGGSVGAVTEQGLITDLPSLELLAGGPVVDADGQVVAMTSRRAAPFGQDPVAVPIRQLCGDLLATCPD